MITNAASRRQRTALLLGVWSAFFATTAGAQTGTDGQALSDNDIRKLLVQRSIASYSGSCPCPENVNRAGRRCGGNSAYSRPGGNRPLCYPSDVTDAMIQRYRDSQPTS